MRPERESVLHSWCRQTEWDAPTITGGRGARFWDESGRSWLDLSSLAECSNLGHQHPAVIRAIREQAERLCFVTAAWGAGPRAELADLLLEKSGFEGGRVFFTLGGADSNEHAVKFARQAAGKPRGRVIARERSYHGASYGAMALSGDSRTRAQADASDFPVTHVPPPYAYRCPYGSSSEEECGRLAAERVGRAIDDFAKTGEDGGGADGGVAAVLMEPDAGTNGIVPPDSYWPRLREVTRERGVSLIADEVMSGFGRCGEWFAWQRHGEAGRPDLMSLAKGLTGAHVPLGAVVLSGQITRRLEAEMLWTGLTYCGHPLACAAGVAALRAYEGEGLIERSQHLGGWLLAELEEMKGRHPSIGDVRGGRGLFAVVELVRDRATREPLSLWPELAPPLRRLAKKAYDEGVSLAVRGNLILLAPPLVIGEGELAEGLAVVDQLLGELDDEVFGAGQPAEGTLSERLIAEGRGE